MRSSQLIIAIATTLLLASEPALAADVRSADRQQSAPLSDPGSDPANYCVGGSEGRKLIPHGGEIRNPFRQTTPIDCESSGGIPTVMPDLVPSVTDGVLA